MNWQIFWLSFSTIFLAEIADKTQLAVISLVSKTKLPLAVFLGTMAAFLLATLVAVIFGELIMRVIPQNALRFLTGSIFAIIGILIFLGKL
ncbi:MAG: TMEM165/GDT1 family protein [Candidatus Omnitrophota bacterium]|nr:TMEM165/GDT1 family protein [Candidatus Omnitrophota bacterium]